MKVLDTGAKPYWPKLLTCDNCGHEALVDGMDDCVRSLPTFALVVGGITGAFRFECPNVCGAACWVVHPAALQQWYHATQVCYGWQDYTRLREGARRVDPQQRKFRAAPRRRRGGSDGAVSAHQ